MHPRDGTFYRRIFLQESLNCISLLHRIRRVELTGICDLSALLTHLGKAHWFAGVYDHRARATAGCTDT